MEGVGREGDGGEGVKDSRVLAADSGGVVGARSATGKRDSRAAAPPRAGRLSSSAKASGEAIGHQREECATSDAALASGRASWSGATRAQR